MEEFLNIFVRGIFLVIFVVIIGVVVIYRRQINREEGEEKKEELKKEINEKNKKNLEENWKKSEEDLIKKKKERKQKYLGRVKNKQQEVIVLRILNLICHVEWRCANYDDEFEAVNKGIKDLDFNVVEFNDLLMELYEAFTKIGEWNFAEKLAKTYEL